MSDKLPPPNRSASEPAPSTQPPDDDDDAWSSRSNSPPPGAQTPTLADVRKSLSFKSLRDLELSTVHKRAWRRPGERKQWPRSFEQLVVFSTRGGLRASLLVHCSSSWKSMLDRRLSYRLHPPGLFQHRPRPLPIIEDIARQECSHLQCAIWRRQLALRRHVWLLRASPARAMTAEAKFCAGLPLQMDAARPPIV